MNTHRIAELNGSLTSRLEDVLAQRVSEKHCPSVFATVFQGSDDLFESGFGESRIGATPPGPETVYRIASCSKSFTATMIVILRDRGLLNLDVPITNFVPEFRQASGERAYDPPTIRMLLSMSGGLPTDDPWADRQESISNEALRSIAASGVHLSRAPGTRFQYSNLGYALLGQVVEVVTGRSFRDVVKEEVLSPLGLRETGYEEDVVPDVQLARGYRKGPDGWVELDYSNAGAFSCIGGLFSSGRDLARWVRWFASATSDEPLVSGPLSVASRREMQQIVTAITHRGDVVAVGGDLERSHGYGFGLFSEDDQRYGQFVSHSGGYPGFSSHMRWHTPTGLGVVVLENATYSGAAPTAKRLIELVLDEIDFHESNVVAWALTMEMAKHVNSLLRDWSDDVATRIFEENVALDTPFGERRMALEALIDELGGLSDSDEGPILGSASDSPLHLSWNVPAARGALACEIRLSPKTPSLIQTFKVSKVSS